VHDSCILERRRRAGQWDSVLDLSIPATPTCRACRCAVAGRSHWPADKCRCLLTIMQLQQPCASAAGRPVTQRSACILTASRLNVAGVNIRRRTASSAALLAEGKSVLSHWQISDCMKIIITSYTVTRECNCWRLLNR